MAEAAIPRFVDKNGVVNPVRNWGEKEKMVNRDSDSKTYDIASTTQDRNPFRPLDGFRRTLETAVETRRCTPDSTGGPEDRILQGYQGCSFELTKRDFERNNLEPIVLYVDTPRSMYSFIETCKAGGQKLCDTEELPPGKEYRFKYTEDWAVRLIFENDDAEDAVFQIEYTSVDGEPLGATSLYQSAAVSSMVILFGALTSILL